MNELRTLFTACFALALGCDAQTPNSTPTPTNVGGAASNAGAANSAVAGTSAGVAGSSGGIGAAGASAAGSTAGGGMAGGGGGAAGAAAAGAEAAGAAGSAGAPGGGGLGGAGGADPGSAASLQGLTIQIKCGAVANQMRSCNYLPPADQNCSSNQVRIYADAMASMGGTPGTFYDVTLRVRGIVEANEYTGGSSDQNGFYTGGNVGGQGGPQYSQYALEISSPKAVYHLNQLDPGAQQDKFKNPKDGSEVHHFGFAIDYRETIKIEGGATVNLRGRDNDCLMGRNCEPPSNDFGKCTLQKVPDLTEPQVPQGASGFDGNFIWIDVEKAVVAQ